MRKTTVFEFGSSLRFLDHLTCRVVLKKLNVGLWNLENNFILLLQTILEKPDMFTFVITEDPNKIYDKCSYIDYNL